MSTIRRCTIAAVVVLLTAVTYAHSITAATDNQQSPSFSLSGPTPGPNGPTSSSLTSSSLTSSALLKDDPKKNAKRDAAAEVDEKSASGQQPQVEASASGIPSQAPAAHYQSVYASYPALGQYYAGAGATAAPQPQIYYVKAPTQDLQNTLSGLQYGGGGPIKLAYAAQSPQTAFTVTGPGNKQYVIQSPYQQPYSNYPAFLAYAPAGNQHLQQPQQHHPQQQQQQHQQQTYIYSQPPPHAQQLHSPALQYSQLALAYATPTSPAAASAANHPQQQQQQQLLHQQQLNQHQQQPQTQIISNYIPHGYQLATVAPAASPLHYQQQQPPLQQVPSSSPTSSPHHPEVVYSHQSQSQPPQQQQQQHHQSTGAAGLAHTYSFVTVPTSLTKPTALPTHGGSINYYAGPSGNHLFQSSIPAASAASPPSPPPQQHQHFQQQQPSSPYHQHQQPQSAPSYIYSSYHHPQQSGPFAQASGPVSQKLIGFSPSPQYQYSAQQYKPLSAPVAPAPPAPTAHSTHPVESATSYATFSQHLSVPHPGAVAASYSSSAPTKQQVLAQPQHYAVAPPTHYASAVHQLSSPQYVGAASSVHPSSIRHVPVAAAAYNGPPLLTAAASATQPHVYASYGGGGGGGGPSAMHGAIHYGTHLYHPTSLSKYGGYGPVAPPSRIVYA